MSNEVNNLYEFGDFRFDSGTNSLWREKELIALSPKASELLKLLVEKDGEIISKREIFDSIWADTFVEDGVLTQNIYTLRNALGTDDSGKQFIETISRRGYRFAAPIKIMSAFEIAPENKKILQTVSVGGKAANSSVESFENQSDAALITHPINNSAVITATPAAFASPSAAAEKIQPRRSFRYAFLICLSGLILSALGFGVYQFAVRRDEKVESKFAPIEQRRFQRLTDSGDVVFPTISPNGEMLAFVRLEENSGSLWVKQIATDSSVKILPSSPKSYRSLVFSPDGRYIFFAKKPTAARFIRRRFWAARRKK